jgi:hypothetical protein
VLLVCYVLCPYTSFHSYNTIARPDSSPGVYFNSPFIDSVLPWMLFIATLVLLLQVYSIGCDSGPSGVTVTVTGPDGLHSQTETVEEGRFTVPGLAPGVYSLFASHPLWKMGQEVVMVEVVGDSASVPSGLTVLGYDVTGHVQSAGTPVAGVQLLLYSDSQTEVDVPQLHSQFLFHDA